MILNQNLGLGRDGIEFLLLTLSLLCSSRLEMQFFSLVSSSALLGVELPDLVNRDCLPEPDGRGTKCLQVQIHPEV